MQQAILSKELYFPCQSNQWSGRVDNPDDEDSYRWHQVIQFIDLNIPEIRIQSKKTSFAFIGFVCDEGIKRNLGRPGASKGPEYLRKELSNLAWDSELNIGLFDCGDVVCKENDLETAQFTLAEAVFNILKISMIPVVLGGGHDIAYGHYMGISRFLSHKKQNKAGIINFDAHFDLRPYSEGKGNSGTMFRQIADLCQAEKLDFNYYCVGIQSYANTKSLFKTATELKVKYEMAKNIHIDSMSRVKSNLDKFIQEQDFIYLSICADVFSSAYAPAVSAPQPFGLQPDIGLDLIKHVVASGKMISFDLAEISPRFEDDRQTAKLGAVVIYAVVNTLASLRLKQKN